VKVLVTGGAGFIGPHIVDRLIKRGDVVRVFDNLSTGDLSNIARYISTGAVELVRGDVRDLAAVKGAAEGCELIYHLAAQSSVPKSTEDPQADMEINVGGTHNVLMAAKEQGSKVVFASSSVVYGRSVKVPTPEGAPLLPFSFYGVSKTAAENYCRTYSELFGVPTVILRLFNIYGPGTNKGLMIDLYRKLMRDPKRLEVLGSGNQKKDYLYIDDTVDAFIMAPERSPCRGEAYNIGLGESYTVFEVAEMMFGMLGLHGVQVHAQGGVSWRGDVELTQPSVLKAELEMGWKAKGGIRDGLAMTLNWFQETLGKIECAR